MNESDLKKTCEDYLTYLMNLGKLWFSRLNAGDFIDIRGDSRRRIKGVEKGTADLVVIMLDTHYIKHCRVIFIELKSGKGRWAPEQRAFKIIIEAQGAEYHIVRNFEELERIISQGKD